MPKLLGPALTVSLLLTACGAPSSAPPAPMPSPGGGGGGGATPPSPTPSVAPAPPSAVPTVAPRPSPTPTAGPPRSPGPVPTAAPSATPRPTPSGAAERPNRAPVLGAMTQTPMKIEHRAQGTLTVTAEDPDGDALTYVWIARDGTLTGSGPTVTYQARGEYAPSRSPDDEVTLTIHDGRGGVDTEKFTVDLFVGTTLAVDPLRALEWDPAAVASAYVTGDVTVTAAGDFGSYGAVVGEYATRQGRRLALLGPGDTTLRGVTGNVYMYVVGVPHDPPEQLAPPALTLSLRGASESATVSVGAAQVIMANDANSLRLSAPASGGGVAAFTFVVGENTATNGPLPYAQLLQVQKTLGEGNTPRVTYGLHGTGDRLAGAAHGSDDSRVLLTDSAGGRNDNTGFWRLYEVQIE